MGEDNGPLRNTKEYKPEWMHSLYQPLFPVTKRFHKVKIWNHHRLLQTTPTPPPKQESQHKSSTSPPPLRRDFTFPTDLFQESASRVISGQTITGISEEEIKDEEGFLMEDNGGDVYAIYQPTPSEEDESSGSGHDKGLGENFYIPSALPPVIDDSSSGMEEENGSAEAADDAVYYMPPLLPLPIDDSSSGMEEEEGSAEAADDDVYYMPSLLPLPTDDPSSGMEEEEGSTEAADDYRSPPVLPLPLQCPVCECQNNSSASEYRFIFPSSDHTQVLVDGGGGVDRQCQPLLQKVS